MQRMYDGRDVVIYWHVEHGPPRVQGVQWLADRLEGAQTVIGCHEAGLP